MGYTLRILIISKECDPIDLGRRLVEEGNAVKYYCDTPGYERVGLGFGIKKVADWKRELGWVGKSGLIIFDYTGFGKTQDELRAQGYAVVGGCEAADRLELDRDYANDILRGHGLTTIPLHHLTIDAALKFIKNNRGPWVIKHNGYVDKTLTYVGKLHDGRDVLDLLKSYRKECSSVVIQKKVEGIELAVARFFNGTDWTGPVEMTMEHKKLFPCDVGPKTSEMGTLMWLDDDENNMLFQQTLARLKPFLQSINFKGKFDINCIINENGPVPLEVTARFGYPALDMSNVLFRPPMGLLLKSVADGTPYTARWHKGFGIVVQVAVPPFPYQGLSDRYNPEGLKIYFKQKPTAREMNHIHFSDVMKRGSKNGDSEYSIVSCSGYVLCVTGVGDTAEQARDKAYGLIEKIVIPKMFFRNDIGGKFIHKDRGCLQLYGWL
ncbi:MAG: hypothetical protein FJ119_07610 [Deltaproteobacteria bacterium]|nr:hypothetical protein [Deltaproteobacteria bacterium]